jgi:hypothetical protein
MRESREISDFIGETLLWRVALDRCVEGGFRFFRQGLDLDLKGAQGLP